MPGTSEINLPPVLCCHTHIEPSFLELNGSKNEVAEAAVAIEKAEHTP